MKILFFSRALGPGGAERQLALMAAGLRRRGHDVAIATFYGGGCFRQIAVGAGVRHISLEKKGRWDVVAFFWRFRRLLEREKPDVLYSLLPPANVISALVARRRVGTCRVWGIRVSDMQLAQYDWLTRLSYAMERHLVRGSDLVIFNSRRGRSLAQARGMAVGRSEVIPNGIDTETFKRDGAVRRAIREGWGVTDDESVVGMIGRFDFMKDHRCFLEAAGALLRTRPASRFVLAGIGVRPENDQLQALIRAAGVSDRVLLLGERQDMPAIMTGLDVLCLSSVGEGFPNVLGEAMAAGTPCVATDVGDCREIVGDTGEIVPPRDPAALAQAIDRLLSRIEQAPDDVRNGARMRVVENFSLARLIDRTEAALEQAVYGPVSTTARDDVFQSPS